MKNMTEGNPARIIIAFALPLLVGNIFQQLYNTVDSIIVGRYVGPRALAAVGTTAPIFFMLISLVLGLGMGATILISQYYGANDLKGVKQVVDTTYVAMMVSAVVLGFLGFFISGPILRMLNTPETLFQDARLYLNIILAGLVPLFGYNIIGGILRGLGDSKSPTIFLIVSTLVNIGLDILFVVGFRMGIAGAAWATVLAQSVAFLFSLWHLNRHHAFMRIQLKRLRLSRRELEKSLRIGIPSGIQQMLFSVGMMTIQGVVNGFGEVAMAGYTAATRIDTFATMPIMNFGNAIATFTGQNVGAGKFHRVKEGMWVTVLMGVVSSLLVTGVLFFYSGTLLRMFTTDQEVIAVGVRYLQIVSLFYVVVSTQFILTGVIRGAGNTMMPMVITMVSLWLIRVPLAHLLTRERFGLGVSGVWVGVVAGWSTGLLLAVLYYRFGNWQAHVRVNPSEEG